MVARNRSQVGSGLMLALVALGLSSCGQVEREEGALLARSSSGLIIFQDLIYAGHANTDKTGTLCANPQSTANSQLDWKWQVVGVPADFLPILMKTEGGTWRASAVNPKGEPAVGQCDRNGRWPLVSKVFAYSSADNTNIWNIFTEPLFNGNPTNPSTWRLYFVDSDGNLGLSSLIYN